MAAKAFIIAHNNKFNKSVINDDAYYFNSAEDITKMLKERLILHKKNLFIITAAKLINYIIGVLLLINMNSIF